MLSAAERQKAAEILLEAEKVKKPALQLSKTFPNIEIEDSYAIQKLVNDAKVKAGSKIVFQMHYTPNGKAQKDRRPSGLAALALQGVENFLDRVAHRCRCVLLAEEDRAAGGGARGKRPAHGGKWPQMTDVTCRHIV